MGKALPGTTTLLTPMKPPLGQERTGFTVATGKRKPRYTAKEGLPAEYRERRVRVSTCCIYCSVLLYYCCYQYYYDRRVLRFLKRLRTLLVLVNIKS